MGKFDSFGANKKPELPASAAPTSGALAPTERDRQARYIAKAQKAQAAGRIVPGTHGGGSFAIALDATGSMASLIDGARKSIKAILDRIYEEAKTRVRVRVYVYRDYDVQNMICQCSQLTGDARELEQWLAQVRVDGGGTNLGEAVEAALEAIHHAGEASAVLIAGDEPSNPRSHLDARGLRNMLSAHDWARRFAQKGIPIHTFVVGSYPQTIRDFQEIAQLSGGQAGFLDGSTAMIDMAVLAMLSSLKGSASVSRYMERYAISDGTKKFGALLLKGPK